MKVKKCLRNTLIGIAASIVAVSLSAVAQDITIWRIGTGGVGGTYFPVGSLIANAISKPPGALDCDMGGTCGVENLAAVPVSTNASVANMNAVHSGHLQAGLAGAQVVTHGFKGTGEFEGSAKDRVRAIATLFREDLHLVVAQEVKLSSIADLNGLRVGIGIAGSGTQLNVKTILDHFGIEANHYELNLQHSAQHLADRKIDAFFYAGGWPFAALIRLGASEGFDLYSFANHEIRKILEILPVYVPSTIPAGGYENIDYEVLTVGSTAHLVTSVDQPEELIYAVTKALWSDTTRSILDRGHQKGRQVTLETALEGLQIPLHRGAQRFYKELGMGE